MNLLDGKHIGDKILREVRLKIVKKNIEPGLAIILVGDDPASRLYVNLKQKACEKCGAAFHKYFFDANTKEEKIIETINFLNTDPDVHGILVQLPLPKNFDEEKILNAIAPEKDVDALNSENLEKLRAANITKQTATNGEIIISPLALSIKELITHTEQPINDKKIVVLANHTPLFDAIKFLFPNNIVEYAAPTDPGWDKTTKSGDILIVCVGKAGFVTGAHIKKDSILIDVGINKTADNKTVGDIDLDSTQNIAAWATPVPGGVGPVTVSMLLKNLLALHRNIF